MPIPQELYLKCCAKSGLFSLIHYSVNWRLEVAESPKLNLPVRVKH